MQVLRKPIRTLRLVVSSPDGPVRVSAPSRVSEDVIRRFVADKQRWIRQQQARLAARPPVRPVAMVSGERHPFLGQAYPLAVVEQPGAARVRLCAEAGLELRVRPAATTAQREALLYGWYRDQLRALVPPLLDRWQPVIGVTVTDWGVRRMRTRWGSCNTRAGRIWLSTELAKKPPACVEYVLVHELVHLLERGHNSRFYGFLDRFLPDWQASRAQLNRLPED